jgi:dUTP pyrophosphatase
MPPEVTVLRLAEGAGLPLPAYMSAGAAGADVVAALDAPRTLAPGERALIPTGFALEVPAGWEVQVRPRSGLAFKHGVTVLNAPGTIDSDYRGAVGVLLVNLGSEPFTIARGDRIAQLIVAPVARALFGEATAIGASDRGAGGFGSTGVR